MGARFLRTVCGLNVSDAIRLFLRQVVAQNGLPFEIKAPNALTRAAMEEARSGNLPRFGSVQELFDDLEKTAKSKSANPPREFSRTKEFKKDWQRLAHCGRYDMNRLKEAMLLLIEDTVPLPPEWHDHALAGN